MIHLRIISVTAALAYNRLCLVGTGIEKTGICDATLGKGPRIYGARNSLILLGNSFLGSRVLRFHGDGWSEWCLPHLSAGFTT